MAAGRRRLRRRAHVPGRITRKSSIYVPACRARGQGRVHLDAEVVDLESYEYYVEIITPNAGGAITTQQIQSLKVEFRYTDSRILPG